MGDPKREMVMSLAKAVGVSLTEGQIAYLVNTIKVGQAPDGGPGVVQDAGIHVMGGLTQEELKLLSMKHGFDLQMQYPICPHCKMPHPPGGGGYCRW